MFHVLVALADGQTHGYAIMKDVEQLTNGSVRLSTGTLYGIIKRLLADGLITHDELTQIEHEADAAVEDSVRFADDSPWPAPESLYHDIYVNPVGSE